MKSTRRASFFTPPNPKRQRTDDKPIAIAPRENMLNMPDEMWVEILRYLNKKQLRDVSAINSFFRNIIEKENLFAKAPWPIPIYEKKLAEKSSDVIFHRLTFSTDIGEYCLYELKNGDIVAGTEDGCVHVLKLRQKEWIKYGQHERATASKSLRKASVYSATLLPSGTLATAGDDGIRLWDRKKHQEIQFLSVPESRFAAKQDGIHELPNGDLISSSKNNQFHLWKKTASLKAPYKYADKLFSSDGTTTQPLIWRAIKYDIVGFGNKHITHWNVQDGVKKQRVEITALKKKIAKTMQSLRLDDVFIATHLDPAIVEIFNDTADHVEHSEFDFQWCIPDKALESAYIIVDVNYFRFMIKPFDDTVMPFYLGCITEMSHIITETDDLIAQRVTLHGLEIIGGFDTSNNSFQHKHTFAFGSVKTATLLDNGHVFVMPRVGIPYIFDIYTCARLHDLSLELPEGVDLDQIPLERLKNGELLGSFEFDEPSRTQFMIWDYQTGRLKYSFFGNGELNELENGDLMTHNRDEKLINHVSVVRFGVKD